MKPSRLADEDYGLVLVETDCSGSSDNARQLERENNAWVDVDSPAAGVALSRRNQPGKWKIALADVFAGRRDVRALDALHLYCAVISSTKRLRSYNKPRLMVIVGRARVIPTLQEID